MPSEIQYSSGLRFPALVLNETHGRQELELRDLSVSDLPLFDLPGAGVLVRVRHSTLNYKDGMILKGMGRMVRRFPHVPGVDFSGVVEASASPDYAPGDKVILTGWRVGEAWWGGYAGMARVKPEWLVKLPRGFTLSRAMALGTAGFTAMLAVMRLEEDGLTPDIPGEVLVTGAAGGLGSVAVAVLAARGYRVAASTGRPEQADYLRGLGATTIIARDELAAPLTRPLLSERWAGCVDSVGGTTLATVLSGLRQHGAVAACGLAGGGEFTASLVPFLLRGIRLFGIDSVLCPKELREKAWRRLARDMPMEKLDAMTTHAELADLPALADKILAGQVRGRTVIDIGIDIG